MSLKYEPASELLPPFHPSTVWEEDSGHDRGHAIVVDDVIPGAYPLQS